MTEDTIPSTHPPIPPTTEDDRLSRLRLLRSRRVGVSTYNRLMAEHGSAQAALSALPEIARNAGVEKYCICPEGVVLAEMKAAKSAGAHLVCAGDANYPAALYDLADAPPLFWAMGDLSLLSKPMIALVGARNASSLGTRMARALAKDLGEAGYCVVSGLARGIDTAAHIAALPTGTIAVQAGGVDVIYPVENTELAMSIAASGLRLSEQPMGLAPKARHFPMRNRIISGLSRATVVVEAAMKSGSLITARTALDQGRDVLAVPGHPFDARASGCNALIRDGAVLVRSAQDVIDALAPLSGATPDQSELALDAAPPAPREPARKPALSKPAQLHKMILSRLGVTPMPEDDLIRDLASSAKAMTPALMDLEMDGKVKRQSGGMVSRVE